MDEMIFKKAAIDALRAIKQGLWEIDIPSPTVPEYVEHHEQIKNMMEIVDGWIKRINEEPAVDAVQVVRCKDCAHNNLPPTAGNAECSIYYGMTEVYGFCHRGERRETDE